MKKEKLAKRLIKSNPAQKKLESVVREWSYRTGSGKPEFTDESISILKDVLKEHDISPELINEADKLKEISFFKNKYKGKDRFRPRPVDNDSGNSNFMEVIEDSPDIPAPNGLLTRVDPPSDEGEVYEVDMVSISPQRTFEGEAYVQDQSGNVYKIIYSSTSQIDQNFWEEAKNPDSVDWGADTFETAACAGVVMVGSQVDVSIENIKSSIEEATSAEEIGSEVRDKIEKVLNSGGYDWEGSGVDEILSKFNKSAPITDYVRFISIAEGMVRFIENETGFSDPSFIHGQIRKYYQNEVENENLDVDGDKDNTADFVVIEGTNPSDFLNKFAEESVSFDENGICYFDNHENIRFVQVSHKENIDPNGAQVGKIKSDFRDAIGLGDKATLDKVVVPSSETVLEEGLMDTAIDKVKSVGQYVSDSTSLFVNKVQGGYKRFKEMAYSAIKNQIAKFSSYVDRFKAAFDSSKEDLNKAANSVMKNIAQEGGMVQEQVLLERRTLPEKAELMRFHWNNFDSSTRERVFSPLYDPAKTGTSLAEQVASQPGFRLINPTDFRTDFGPYKDKIDDSSYITKIYITFQAGVAMQKLLRSGDSDVSSAKKTLEKFIDLQAKMHFGKTELPIWKVGSEDTHFLQDPGSFKEEKRSFLKNEDGEEMDVEEMDLVGFKSVGQDNGTYGTFLIAIADGFDEETQELTYTKIELRSEGHLLQFTVSGESSGRPKSQVFGD